MGSSSVLLVVDTQLVDSGVQSDAPRRRDAPREPKLAVNPHVGVIVRLHVQDDELAARHVPRAFPPGAEELAGQPRIVLQEVERSARANVVDERHALEITGQPDLPAKSRLFRQPLTEQQPGDSGCQGHRQVRYHPPARRGRQRHQSE